jgi:hypothetical protein
MKPVKQKDGTYHFEMSEVDYSEALDCYVGYCIQCGADRDSCEPDAEEYPCESCDGKSVFGTEQLLIMGKVILTD